MQIKTFTGRNTQAVLAMVKAELGGDAVILSTREGQGEDGAWCEVTAGLDRPLQQHAAESAMQAGSNGNGMGNGSGAAQAIPAGWGQWHREWNDIKEHLVALIKPGLKLEELSPRQRVALEFLEREGVEDTVLMSVVRDLRQDRDASVLSSLSAKVAVQEFSAQSWPQRFHAFAGPYGSGKTSTVLRMALMLKRQQPELKICLVNADCERGNGRMLLRHYAELSDIAYREAATGIEFAAAVRESGEYDKIFIDLPALARGRTLAELAADIGLEAAPGLAVHLLLSPSYAPAQLDAFQQQYATPRPGSIIWTKLDEACTFGAVVNVAVRSGRPVSALSFGPGLSNSLTAARDVMLWRLIFKHQLPGGTEAAM